MNLFVRLTRWADYLAGQTALADIDERLAEARLSKTQALVLLRDWGGSKDDRVTLARAQRDCDPMVEQAAEHHRARHAYRKPTETLANNVERDAAVVSRELSRRIGLEPKDRRANRWTP